MGRSHDPPHGGRARAHVARIRPARAAITLPARAGRPPQYGLKHQWPDKVTCPAIGVSKRRAPRSVDRSRVSLPDEDLTRPALFTAWERYRELPRYAEGMSSRLFALREDGSGPERDLIATLAPHWKRFTGAVAAGMSDERRRAEESSSPQAKPGKAPLPQAKRAAPTVNLDAGEWAARPGKLSAGMVTYRWALEEARLGLFAPDLGGTVNLTQLEPLWVRAQNAR